MSAPAITELRSASRQQMCCAKCARAPTPVGTIESEPLMTIEKADPPQLMGFPDLLSPLTSYNPTATPASAPTTMSAISSEPMSRFGGRGAFAARDVR